MEKLVEELKGVIKFKDTTIIGDIVLIAAKKPQMLVYALVENIKRDETKQDEWWHVTMQVLTVPIQSLTWILRTPQMTGMEIFSMGGEKRFVKAVDFNGDAPKKSSVDKKKRKKAVLRLVK